MGPNTPNLFFLVIFSNILKSLGFSCVPYKLDKVLSLDLLFNDSCKSARIVWSFCFPNEGANNRWHFDLTFKVPMSSNCWLPLVDFFTRASQSGLLGNFQSSVLSLLQFYSLVSTVPTTFLVLDLRHPLSLLTIVKSGDARQIVCEEHVSVLIASLSYDIDGRHNVIKVFHIRYPSKHPRCLTFHV